MPRASTKPVSDSSARAVRSCIAFGAALDLRDRLLQPAAALARVDGGFKGAGAACLGAGGALLDLLNRLVEPAALGPAVVNVFGGGAGAARAALVEALVGAHGGTFLAACESVVVVALASRVGSGAAPRRLGGGAGEAVDALLDRLQPLALGKFAGIGPEVLGIFGDRLVDPGVDVNAGAFGQLFGDSVR